MSQRYSPGHWTTIWRLSLECGMGNSDPTFSPELNFLKYVSVSPKASNRFTRLSSGSIGTITLSWKRVRRHMPLVLRKQPSEAPDGEHLFSRDNRSSLVTIPSIEWRWNQLECRGHSMVLARLPLNTREFKIPVETWWETLNESCIEREVGDD